MKQWIEIWRTQKKNGKDNYMKMENVTGKKIVGHSKLMLWTVFWDHSECEWPLLSIICVHIHVYTYTLPEMYHNYQLFIGIKNWVKQFKRGSASTPQIAHCL